jgi:sugar phosphate isomerase/epimerase
VGGVGGQFPTLAQKAEQAGLKFCLEPRVGEMVSNTDAALRLFDHVGHENLGFVLDTGHLNAQKELLPLSVEKLGKRIFYVHLSDNDGKTNEHLGLGRGTVDFEGVFLALKKHGFSGWSGWTSGASPTWTTKCAAPVKRSLSCWNAWAFPTTLENGSE